MRAENLIQPGGFEKFFTQLQTTILHQPLQEVGRWQSQDRPEAAFTREILDLSFIYQVPESVQELQDDLMPNLPWAEDHFMERVSGEPLNPPPSEAWWPFARAGNSEHKKDAQFSHTYPERIWPKRAGRISWDEHPAQGIRYPYGDLRDVVKLICHDPGTRQAYLPIWFPEDTGLGISQRVPCSIGYQFLIRQGELHVFYTMRSCDLMRHFVDDIYMAARLGEWMSNVLNQCDVEQTLGRLHVHIASLHTFKADDIKLKEVAHLYQTTLLNQKRHEILGVHNG